MTLRIGTRGSELALYQAHAVAEQLRAKAGADSEIVVIKTSGDRLTEATLTQIGGKRLFVKEIEDALLAREVDLAVHSSKDMPVLLPDGLTIAGVLPREDPRDAVVLPASDNGPLTFEALVTRLGMNPRIGTSSVRRTAQLARLFPGATFLPIRGNLGTRLRKLDEGQFDAIVLAAAGLIRLEHRERISTVLPIAACIPAPGQGIIAVEARTGDHSTAEAVAAISDLGSKAALDAERAVVTNLGGGCQMPIGVHAEITEAGISLVAVVLSLDGARAIRAESRASMSEAENVGTVVAEDLRAQGAEDILADVQRAHAAVEGIQP
jgi:hydroxymethylbilane synthase